MYKLFLCLRYLRSRRIAFFAVGAVCLCVAMVLIVFSVMDGFLQMVRDRSRGMLGDLIVENNTFQGFPFYEDFITGLNADPVLGKRIHKATPVVITYGVIRFPEAQLSKAVQVVGIKLEETYEVNEFKKGLFYEKYYPGTTTFEPRGEPFCGYDAEGASFVLPPELESAYKRWEKNAAREEIEEAWSLRTPTVWLRRVDLDDEEKKECIDDLNHKRLAKRLREVFQDHQHTLPADPRVDVLKEDERWRIDAPDDSYILRVEKGALEVIGTVHKGPGWYRYLSPALVGRLREDQPDLEAGRPAIVEPELPGIVLGTDICAERQRNGKYDRRHWRGETVQLTTIPMTDTGKLRTGSGAASKLFRYIDDCRTGIYDIDSLSVYVDFSVLQTLLEMDGTQRLGEDGPLLPARATQIQIKLEDNVDPQATRDLIADKWTKFMRPRLAWPGVRVPNLLREVRVVTWEEKQAKFIGAVEKEKYLVTILFGIISLVAVILVGSIFYMIVQQKTRDIGIIKSVGATSSGVAQIFIAYGAAVGVVGGAIGILIGTVFVWYINDIQDWLTRIHPSAQVWNPEVYTFDRIPNQVDPWHAVVIYGVAILASMLGSVIAARRASRVWPVEALRYE